MLLFGMGIKVVFNIDLQVHGYVVTSIHINVSAKFL